MILFCLLNIFLSTLHGSKSYFDIKFVCGGVCECGGVCVCVCVYKNCMNNNVACQREQKQFTRGKNRKGNLQENVTCL